MIGIHMDPSAPNAFAAYYLGRPTVFINRPLLNQVVEGNSNRLAFVVGHELSHIVLGHARPRSITSRSATVLLETIFSREQETAADRNGIKLALAANYDFAEAMQAPKRFIALGLEHPPLWPADHPSWSQRLALMEKNRASLWQSVGAFNNGVFFLNIEQYVSAERCFSATVEQFPDAYEAQANLGYARLMQYCDLLRAEDVAGFGIGQIMVDGFYDRPDSLIAKGKGINAELWKQAVEALEAALRLKPDLALAKASLGVAYLVRPERKDVEKAIHYLEEASSSASSESTLSPALRAVILINLGVADLAGGKADAGDKCFRDAYRLAGTIPAIQSVILFNHALSILRSSKADNKQEAATSLAYYLKTSSPASIWWKIGLDNYSRLCGEPGLQCESEQQIRAATGPSRFRPLPPVELSQGVRVQLGDSIDDVQKRLGPGVELPVAQGFTIKRYRYQKYGIDVIGSDQVIAVDLNKASAPALKLQQSGAGGKTSTLKVGMTRLEVARVLGPTSVAATVFSPTVPFRFYPQVGLAARFERGVVAEWLVVIIPRKEA
jgi:tetratricopeptide (TPR) repeat protein